ncbi:MAG TPA: MATE family efflux transporter [Clostridiales bacterium]|nr:MATE family efflux transporter [Clostridiales bacterium]
MRRWTSEDINRHFYRTMLTIALPIIIQHLISIGLNMVDTVMIGRLGENELAAIGIANRIYFMFAIFCFGFYSGASVFVSQYWGVKDIGNIRKIFGIEITGGLIISSVFTMLLLIFPYQIMGIFINDPIVIAHGVDYLRIVSLIFMFTSLSFAISFNSRSIRMIKVPTIINVIAIALNTFLNYCLIYGNFGMPMLGIKGAALATFIARLLEFVLLSAYVYKDRSHPLAGTVTELFSWEKSMLKKVFKTSFPVFINEVLWVTGTSVYYIAYGLIGAEAVAVVQVSFTISDFFQSLFFGIGGACAVMIGNELGRNEIQNAYTYALRFIKITFVFSILISILMYLIRIPIIGFYDFKESTNLMLSRALIVSAIFLAPKMQSYMIIVGILRSGGDTRFCMVTDSIFVWLIGIPLAFISVLVFKWPIYLVLAAVFVEEVFKFAVIYSRVLSKKWLNNLIS